MSNEPILLFLHGVGDGDRDDTWKVSCSEALTRLGYPDLDAVEVIAPKFAHALKGWDDEQSLPAVTMKQLSGETARKNRQDFQLRMRAVEFRLGPSDRGDGQLVGNAIVDVAVGSPFFTQAHNYLTKPQIRAQVLNRILSYLPESGRLIIVGHSLGSVIAADLLRHLPPWLEVAGMVTIGSPLANGNFDVDRLRETLKEPPTTLAWWVNFWNPNDPVAARRGVSSVIPWVTDFRTNAKNSILTAHDATEYLSNDVVTTAIGFALFGSRSQELVTSNKGLDIPLDATEILAVLALRYAYLMMLKLKGDEQYRFAGALRQVQASAVDEITRRNAHAHRPMPSDVARLAFDLSDPRANVPVPDPIGHIGKDDAVMLMTILAAENLIRPFELSVSQDKRQKAMEDLCSEMGLGRQYGIDVFTAAKRAHEALAGSGVNWVKWGALGAGAAAIIVATGGLALAAAPGLAGAAVVTSALASFGPGGMIGGLVTAGTLVTAGGSGITYGLASAGTSADTLEAVVVRRLSAAILRQLQHLEPDPTVWRDLVEIEIEIRREHERIRVFSDKSAPALKELVRKIGTIELALKYLKDHDLEPGVLTVAEVVD